MFLWAIWITSIHHFWPITYIHHFLAHYTFMFWPFQAFFGQYELYMIFWPLIHYFLPISIVHLNDLHYCWPILLFNCFIFGGGGWEVLYIVFLILLYIVLASFKHFVGPLWIIHYFLALYTLFSANIHV